VADAIRAFLRELLSKFVTFQAIRNGEDITEVDFENRVNQLDDTKMTIGLTTKQCLHKLLDEGYTLLLMIRRNFTEYSGSIAV